MSTIAGSAVLLAVAYLALLVGNAKSVPTDVTDYQHLRFIRNVGVTVMPPPMCPPPPNVTCNKDCGESAVRVLRIDTCECICTQIIPAACPTPIPYEKTKTTRKSKTKKTPKSRRGRRSHSRSRVTSSDGCPELTPKGRRYKKIRTKSKGSRVSPSPLATLEECPSGQELNATTCQCMRM